MTLYVYILASKPQGTLYIGVTNDLIRRVIEHYTGLIYFPRLRLVLPWVPDRTLTRPSGMTIVK